MIEILKKIKSKRYEEAHKLCIDLIHKDVNDARAYYGLGIITFDHKNFTKAAELYGKATELEPKRAAFWAAYGKTLSLLGRQSEAHTAIENAAKLPIQDAITADTIAVVYSRTGFHERAIPFFQQAITLDPQPANFYYNLGSSLQFSGRFEEAAEAYQNTISREPNSYKAYSGLVALRKQTKDTSKLEKLTTLFEKNHKDADATLHLGHAIAKTYEDLGEHDQSLHWLTRAKTMNAAKFAVDIQAQSALFEAAKSTFNGKRGQGADLDTSAPIFVVGLPRTGTTLVDRILSSHPEVTAAGETNVFAGLVKVATQTTDNMVLDAKTLLAATSVNMAPIGRHYVANTKALARGAPRFTDKMPLNFFYAGLIHKALPNARIIVLRRGAMDSCISNYRQLFSTQYSYYNYTYNLESTGHFYRGFDDLIAHWKATLPANRFMEVHYEDIVFDQEAQTRKLLEFCDLSWDEACLRFHENDTPVSTASSVQVRQPLYAGSIGRWKKYSTGLTSLRKALGDLAET